ncbi:DUF4352 domain-containing protein [Candidatus Clostridium stratigraminis]|uniref:DUF4352 domain-containing protein n=1 Tax=Candidatus Clostridium stratigraminis TaxID=3381661 RepID=A0ABW8T1N4_9CLOT
MILGVTTLVLAIFIVGCSNGNTPTKVGENNTATTSSNTDTKSETKTFKVGDVVQLKNLKITVNKVYTVKPTDVFKPADGKDFFAVDCTIENTSKDSQAISSMIMFKVVDKDGRSCEYSITGLSAANAGQLDGEVGAGRKMTGVYVVEVPKGQTGLELEFDSSFLTGGQVIVKLN